jgi:hypothetical protein
MLTLVHLYLHLTQLECSSNILKPCLDLTALLRNTKKPVSINKHYCSSSLFPWNWCIQFPFSVPLSIGNTIVFICWLILLIHSHWRQVSLSSSFGAVTLCRSFLLSTDLVNGWASLGNGSGILHNVKQSMQTSAKLGTYCGFSEYRAKSLTALRTLEYAMQERFMWGKGREMSLCSLGTRWSAVVSGSHCLILAFTCAV